MSVRGTLAAAFLAACLLACGPAADQVNNAGHEPYLQGDYASALESYQGAVGRAPGSGEPYYNSANVLYRMGEYEEALKGYDESLILADGELRSRGFFNRGNTAFQQEDFAEAVTAYEEVLRMNPDDMDAKHNLELALLRMSPQDQQENEQEQDQQEQDQQEEEMDDQEEDEPEEVQEEQEQPITETQARQILESVGEAAQTLQERRGQVLVSPKPPSEYDW